MKLTSAQQKVVIQALVFQLQGYYIALGRRWGYNDNEVSAMKLKEHYSEGRRVTRDNDSKVSLGNGIFRNTLDRTELLGHVPQPTTKWDEFYNYRLINVSKLLTYDNGRETMDLALDELSEKIVKNKVK
jgi:hypothetical protein